MEPRMKYMPDDFYPDEIIVVAKYKGAELAFAITKDRLFDGTTERFFMRDLKALRIAIWQAVEDRHAAD
jgi:hypothetical protein